jgi:hypothetical protein
LKEYITWKADNLSTERLHNLILLWEVEILEFIVQVLNSSIHSEKSGRDLIFICCGINNGKKKFDNGMQSFQVLYFRKER